MYKYLILPLLLGFSYQAQAFAGKLDLRYSVERAVLQEEVRGTVTAMDGKAIAGATVKNLQTGRSVMTDQYGKFQITANQGETLQVTYVGYQSIQQRVVGNQLNLQLGTDADQLEEVLVVGYGTQSRTTISGSVSSSDLKGVSSRSLAGVGDVLQGKTPGVTVSNEGGDPTSSPRVNIRGLGGINGERPLYVVDGVLMMDAPQINPNDIQEISVLRDAAAAVYGSRASGGVILITTKSGKSGDLRIELDAKFAKQQPHNLLQSLNAADRASIANQAADNANAKRDPAFDASVYPDGQVTRTDWMDEIFRNANTQEYNLAASGGNEKSTFFSSFNYRNAEGILINTYGKRYNFRLNSQSDITPWLKFGENVSYSYSNGQGANTNSGYTGAILSAIYYPRNVSVYDDQNKFSGLPAQYGPGSYGDVINPVAYLKRLDVNNPTHNLLINPYIELKLMEGLKFKSNFAYSKQFTDFKEFKTKVPEIGKPVMTNSLTLNNYRFTDILAEQTLTYEKDFGLHHFDGLAGYMYQETKNYSQQVIGDNFDDESPIYRYMVNAGNIQPVYEGTTKSALISYLLRANYNYDSRYMISLIGRRDGTSLVASKNQFQNYFSASAAWSIHRESFLSEADWLSMLKLRGSYGILGNLASLPATAVSPLLERMNVWIGQTPALNSGYAENVMGNPELTWAESKQSNVGLDMGIWNNRLTVNVDYYVKKTNNMIMDINLPGTTGVGSKTVNGGLIKDSGIELALSYNSKPEAAFQYSVTASVNKINNHVESLAGGLNSIYLGNNYRGILRPIMVQAGQPLYSYYGLKTDGLFRTKEEADSYKNNAGQKIQPNAQAGDMKFIDIDGDGVIDSKDRVFLGSAYPDFNYGLTFNASYKNFDFNIFFQGVQGNKLFNALKYTGLNAASGQPYNMLEGVKDAYSATNTGSDIPRLSVSDPNGNFSRVSDFYVEDGSYLRVKNLIVGYTLPANLSQKFHAQRLRVYASATNLLTFTKYSGMDPEIGMDNYGMDSGRYPQARNYMLGLSLAF